MLNPGRKLSQDPVFNNLLQRDRLAVLRSPLDELDPKKRNGTASLDTVAAAIAGRLLANHLTLLLPQAQALPAGDPPGVVANALYGITGDWNDVDTDSTVYVHGVTPTAYHRLGVVYDAQGVAQLVEVDVVAGTYKELTSKLYDELGFQADGAPTNRLLANTFDAAVAKNVLVSTGDSYITAQEAIDNAFPVGAYRDTVVLRGYQRGYQLGDNSLTIDGSTASFSADNSILIGLLAGPAMAFNHSLVGGTYAGSLIISSHNGGTANKLTLTELVLSDASSLNFVLNLAQASGLIDVVELVRARGVKTVSTGNPYGNGLINFRGNTYEGHRPIRLNLRGCDLASLVGPLFSGTAPRGTTIHLYEGTKLSSSTANNLQRVRSADEAGSTVAFTDAELIVDERPATGGTTYTDAQARAAQLGRTAPANTSSITLTAESPIDYSTFSSGTPTIDATGCVVGKGARFAVGAGAQAPAFTNAPSGRPYKYYGATYASGKAFSYTLYVCVDRIEVVIIAD